MGGVLIASGKGAGRFDGVAEAAGDVPMVQIDIKIPVTHTTYDDGTELRLSDV